MKLWCGCGACIWARRGHVCRVLRARVCIVRLAFADIRVRSAGDAIASWTWSVCVAARTMDAIPLMWDERRLVFAACLCDYRPCEPEAHHASAVPRGRAARARREWRDYKTKLGLLFSGRVDKVVCLVLVPHASDPASGPQRAAWPQEPQVALALWQRRACRADSRTGPTPRPSTQQRSAHCSCTFVVSIRSDVESAYESAITATPTANRQLRKLSV